MKEIFLLHDIFCTSSGVSTDSRNILPNSLFFALKGESFDGNLFAEKALQAGASYAVVDDPEVYKGSHYILVDDVLTALQQLAAYHRMQFDIPVVALTGSNGKTTTKELLTKVLAVKFKVLSTVGNLNNHIGVPLTLLNIDNKTEIAVIEMGASAPGEIRTLAATASPTTAIITNVGKAHLLGFNSFEGIKKAKGELYDYIGKTGGTVLYNIDNKDITEMVASRPSLSAIPYGTSISGVKILDITPEDPFLKLSLNDGEVINTKLIGSYNTDNILAALAAGAYFGCDRMLSVKAIESYSPSNNRSQLIKGTHNNLIVDAYNANPTSMKAALDNFDALKTPVKGVVLGDMLELGEDSAKEHLAILNILEKMEVRYIFLVGKEFIKAAKGYGFYQKNAVFAETSEELKENLTKHKPTGAAFLIKGSRGIKLEKVLDTLN